MCLSVCLWQRVKQLVLQRAGINESISLGAFVKTILPQLEPACKEFFHVCYSCSYFCRLLESKFMTAYPNTSVSIWQNSTMIALHNCEIFNILNVNSAYLTKQVKVALSQCKLGQINTSAADKFIQTKWTAAHFFTNSI